MGRQTYYIVQLSPQGFVRKDAVGFGWGFGIDKAAHLTLAGAHRLYREYKATSGEDTPRRFPRVLKITTETKTITPRRKK